MVYDDVKKISRILTRLLAMKLLNSLEGGQMALFHEMFNENNIHFSHNLFKILMLL
jgi:hypothetical protein